MIYRMEGVYTLKPEISYQERLEKSISGFMWMRTQNCWQKISWRLFRQ
ncbi:MAG: hypothetical protein ACLTXT_00100 [Ruminococcus callidus]